MSETALFQELQARVNTFSDQELQDLKDSLLQEHARRHRQETQQAEVSIVEGMEQLFSQLDPATVQMLKTRIQEAFP